MSSISGLSRIEVCAAAAVLPQVDDAGSRWAARGRALHAYLAAIAEGKSVSEALDLVLNEHGEEFVEVCLAVDLSLVPHSQAGAWLPEYKVAYDYAKRTARHIERTAHRDYGELAETEIPGTADLVGVETDIETGERRLVVLDLKTGWRSQGKPGESLQLLGYAVACAHIFKCSKATVGWLYYRPGEDVPVVVVDELDEFQLVAAQDRIEALMLQVEWARAVGPAEVKPVVGEHCRYCPAYRACPANTSMLQALRTNHIDLASAGVAGLALVEGVATIEAADLPLAWERLEACDALLKRVRAVLEDAVKTVGSVPLGDGRVLGVHETTRESLDAEKAKPILDALFGPGAAERAVKVPAPELTKKAVEVLVRERTQRTKETIKDVNNLALEQLRKAGAVHSSSYQSVSIRKVK